MDGRVRLKRAGTSVRQREAALPASSAQPLALALLSTAMAHLRLQDAAAGDDATASNERLLRLFDDVAPFVLPLLPLDTRARAACARKAWRAAAAEPMLWAELDFERCAVRVTEAKLLATLCSRAGPALRSLRLSTATLRSTAGAALLAALRDGGCIGVQRISVCGGIISVLPAVALQLAAACPALEHMECQVVSHGFAEAARVAAALPGPLALSVADVSVAGVRQDDGFLRRLLQSSVVYLDLSKWGLPAAELAMLFGALHENKTLTELILNTSNAGSAAAALSEALRVNDTLTHLNLGRCGIDAAGVVALAALRVNSTLKSLGLEVNRVGLSGAVALGRALHDNSTLTSLNLRGNGIGNEGAAALGQALRVNNTLTQLNLSENEIDDDGAASLGEALHVNKSLAMLELDRTGISTDGFAALRAACISPALKFIETYG